MSDSGSDTTPTVFVDFEVDRRGEWRWTASDAGNHEDMGVASEGYEHQADAVSAARQLMPTATFRFPPGHEPHVDSPPA